MRLVEYKTVIGFTKSCEMSQKNTIQNPPTPMPQYGSQSYRPVSGEKCRKGNVVEGVIQFYGWNFSGFYFVALVNSTFDTCVYEWGSIQTQMSA